MYIGIFNLHYYLYLNRPENKSTKLYISLLLLSFLADLKTSTGIFFSREIEISKTPTNHIPFIDNQYILKLFYYTTE